MMWHTKFFPGLLFLSFLGYFYPTSSVEAQITPDNSLGSENSIVTPNVTVKDALADFIEGGAIRGNNLFHSFEQFNVGDGGNVYFANPDGIANILTRVTGNNISEIFGTLGVDGAANLFLLNPNGIVFGENAALDVSGSFLATTADSYLFENEFAYSASNPETPPLLTINLPLGVQFGNQAESIINQSLSLNEFDESVGLEVSPESNITLVGGEIDFKGGMVTAPNGSIEIGSVAANSLVNIIPTENDWTLDYTGVESFQDISLTEFAGINSSGDGAGNINIHANNLSVLEGSFIAADNFGERDGDSLKINTQESLIIEGLGSYISADLFASGKGADLTINTAKLQVTDEAYVTAIKYGLGDGGNINLVASESIEIKSFAIIGAFVIGAEGNGGNIRIQAPSLLVDTGLIDTSVNQGNGGDITLEVDSLRLLDGAQLFSGTFGEGNVGNINIKAQDIEIRGVNSTTGRPSLISTSVESGGIGDAGDITLEVDSLSLLDGAQVFSGTFGEGNAGNINIQAPDIQLIDVDSTTGRPSLISTSVESGGIGDAGDITLEVDSLSLLDGAQVLSGTFGEGNAGNINIQAQDIELRGVNSQTSFPSGILASVEAGGIGDAGDITLDVVDSLSLLDGGQIFSGNFGEGNAGNINIQAPDIQLKGVDLTTGRPSGIFASVQAGGIGDAGDITLDVDSLNLLDGGIMNSSTSGEGNAGNINIQAQDIQLRGVDSTTGRPSSILASVEARGIGDAGDIALDVDSLSFFDGAQVLSGTFGEGNAGNINIQAQDIELRGVNSTTGRPSGILASVQAGGIGDAGDIVLDVVDSLRLFDGAQVFSGTLGEGNAGNINIQAPDIKLIDVDSTTGRPSGILASVEAGGIGDAGDITLDVVDSLSLFDGAQVFSGTSGEGNGGNINIQAPDIQLGGVNSQTSFPSGILASVQVGGIGDAGDITLDVVDSLSLLDGGQVFSGTFGEGNAGNINIQAPDIQLRGVDSTTGRPSGILASVEAGGIGDAGDIILDLDSISLLDGAIISSSTSGEGNGGNITIQAQNINIVGSSKDTPIFDLEQESLTSSISAFSQGDFAAGTININTDTLNLKNQSNISVSNFANGNSGNLNITAGELNLDNSATIEAEVNAGTQGNINLTTDDIFLRNNSQINAKATGTATGGNVTINNTDNIVLLENSQIIADAIEGNGGNIDITTQGLFVSSDSLISASSEFGLDGNVEIKEVNGDRKFELSQLPENITDITNLITATCSAKDNNAVAVVGNGGLPKSPYQTQSLNTTWYDLRPVEQEKNEISSIPTPLTEATATIINSDGELELVALTPLSTHRWVKSGCQV